MRIADFICSYLADLGFEYVFMVTGGGAMHLNDAFSRESRFKVVCNHHEQASAIASEGYARIKGKPGLVCVTSGPGGTNAVTGVLGQWLDSIPAIYLSGQVRYDTTVKSTGLPLRQFGDQEANIVEIVKPITKYAFQITDPKTIRFHLEKALYLATTGRPGPVWLDIPLNVQSAQVNELDLTGFDEEDEEPLNQEIISKEIDQVIDKILASKRPLIFGGAGVRLAGATKEFLALVNQLKIPVQVAWDAIDLIPSNHSRFAGRPSTLGQRGANFIFQNCDLLLNIGCRLNTRQIGFNFPSVAREAYKISVDIDENELHKPSIKLDLPIHMDAKLFINELSKRLKDQKIPDQTKWMEWCRQRLERYPVVLKQYSQKTSPINPYVFCESLSAALEENDIIVSSNGASCVIPIQTMEIKPGQRHIVNSGCAGMGYGLPSSIGACFANNKQRVICLEGDGSIQMNIQELQTIVFHQLPIKIFIFNNAGYLSIRTTQANFFNGQFIGESEKSGVSFPDMVKIGQAYGIESIRIENANQLKQLLPEILGSNAAVICDVSMDPAQTFVPRITSKKLPNGTMVSSPLEDMYPFLERDEFLSNMIIKPWNPEINQ